MGESHAWRPTRETPCERYWAEGVGFDRPKRWVFVATGTPFVVCWFPLKTSPKTGNLQKDLSWRGSLFFDQRGPTGRSWMGVPKLVVGPFQASVSRFKS